MPWFDVWPDSMSREWARYITARDECDAARKLAKTGEFELPLKICVCQDDGHVTCYEARKDECDDVYATELE